MSNPVSARYNRRRYNKGRYNAAIPAAGIVTPSYTVSGPVNGTTGVQSTVFTVTPSTSLTDGISFSDSGGGGTFTPSSLSWSSSSTPKTFTYTPGSTGTKTLTLTSSNSYAITGSPLTYVSLAVSSKKIKWCPQMYYRRRRVG